MEIRLYRPPETGDVNFIPVGITNAAKSIRYKESFYSYGDFEITIPTGAYGAAAFEKYLLAYIDRRFWGLILDIGYALDDSGDNMTVTGVCIKGMTGARFTMPPGFTYEQVGGTAGYDVANGSTETCMKHFMTSNFFNPNSPTRSVPGLVIAPDQGRGNPADYYMTRFALLSTVLEDLGKAAKIGYSITPVLTTGEFVFDVVEGADRSAEQSVNPRIVFEVRRGNIERMEYQDSDRNMKNVFYATLSGAKYEDEAYTATITRDGGALPSGLRRWEQHLDISASHPIAGQEFNELQRLTLIQAQSYETVNSFSAVILDTRKKYGVDYHLGDIVTVINREWGVSTHTRITAVDIDASDSGVKYTATFGDAPINFIERLRRQIRGG